MPVKHCIRSGLGCASMMMTTLLLRTLLFVLCLSPNVLATVTVLDERYESLPAAFGMMLQSKVQYKAHLQFQTSNPTLCPDTKPQQDLENRMELLQMSNENNATTTNIIIPKDGFPIALLVSRGSCSFEDKARLAQSLSSKVEFVLVYDDQPRSYLVPMSATNPNGITVGMLFVSHAAGTLLHRSLASQSQETLDSGGVFISIDSVPPRNSIVGPGSVFSETQEFMLAALSGFFTLVACFGCLIVCVQSGYIRREGNVIMFGRFPTETQQRRPLLTREQVLRLPEVQYNIAEGLVSDEEKSEASPILDDRHDSCPICIDEYQAGDTLRLLPCGHKFHTDCIVPWLTERHSSCPLCKHDIVANSRIPQLASDESSSEETRSWFSSDQMSEFWQQARRRGEMWHRRYWSRHGNNDMLQNPLLADPRSPLPQRRNDSDNESNVGSNST